MKLKPFFIAAAVTSLSLCLSQNSFAQSSTAISGQRLAAIEQEMFNDSNENFIVVDLIIDGVMKPGDACAFKYDNGVSYFRNKKLGDKLQAKYAARFNEFEQHIGRSPNIMLSITSDPVTEQAILDPNSHFRNPPANMVKKLPELLKMHGSSETK